jgi:hypothetical protein
MAANWISVLPTRSASLLVISVVLSGSANTECVCGVDRPFDVKYIAPPAEATLPRATVVGLVQGQAGVSIYATTTLLTKGTLEYRRLKFSKGKNTWTSTKHAVPTVDKLAVDQIASGVHPQVWYKLEDGIYKRSKGGGRSWETPKMIIDGVGFQAFARMTAGEGAKLQVVWAGFNPKQPHVIYASFAVLPTKQRLVNAGGLSTVKGLYVSHDRGDNWELFTSQVSASSSELTPAFPVLGISPSNPRLMFAFSDTGLLRTKDGGKTWSMVGEQEDLEALANIEGQKEALIELERRGLRSAYSTASRSWRRLRVSQILFEPESERTVYLVTNKGLYRSVDGGETWCLLRVGSNRLGAIDSLAINPSNVQELFVGAEGGLFRSRDAGCTFTRVLSVDHSRKEFTSKSFTVTDR